MPRGIIKKLARLRAPLAQAPSRPASNEDGYGLIDGDRQEVFFLASVVAAGRFAELCVGDLVDYEIEPGPLGRAARVAPLRDASPAVPAELCPVAT